MPPQIQPPQQTIWPLRCLPGVKRDGTQFEGSAYTDGIWTRFQRALPRSIGGYQQTATGFHGPSRGCAQFSSNGLIYFASGSANLLEQASVAPSGATAGVLDRTPAGFVTDPNNVWQFDHMSNAAAGARNSALIAHAAPNLAMIDSDITTKVWYGDATGSAALVDTGATQIAGGIVVLHPFLFTYDSFGNVAWSDENQPTVWTGGASGNARITEAKIVKGMVVRGGPGYSPAGLFWSLNSLCRASFIGGSAIFQFDTISDQISVLSSSAIVEYDSLFYWPGIDRFLVYNGIVREVPNSLNLNWFYDNLNQPYAQKVWGTKVPHFGEIWWFYPRYPSTECNDAIIYNVRENTWYDAGLAPGANRSSGIYPQVTPNPLWLKATADADNSYSLWRHEIGTDEVFVSGPANAILSAIETSDLAWCGQGPMPQGWVGIDRNVTLSCFEQDFVQTQPMTLIVKGVAYAQGSPNVSTSYPFGPGTANLTRIDMSGEGIERREMTLRIESNITNGAWQMGQILVHLGLGSQRPSP